MRTIEDVEKEMAKDWKKRLFNFLLYTSPIYILYFLFFGFSFYSLTYFFPFIIAFFCIFFFLTMFIEIAIRGVDNVTQENTVLVTIIRLLFGMSRDEWEKSGLLSDEKEELIKLQKIKQEKIYLMHKKKLDRFTNLCNQNKR